MLAYVNEASRYAKRIGLTLGSSHVMTNSVGREKPRALRPISQGPSHLDEVNKRCDGRTKKSSPIRRKKCKSVKSASDRIG